MMDNSRATGLFAHAGGVTTIKTTSSLSDMRSDHDSSTDDLATLLSPSSLYHPSLSLTSGTMPILSAPVAGPSALAIPTSSSILSSNSASAVGPLALASGACYQSAPVSSSPLSPTSFIDPSLAAGPLALTPGSHHQSVPASSLPFSIPYSSSDTSSSPIPSGSSVTSPFMTGGSQPNLEVRPILTRSKSSASSSKRKRADADDTLLPSKRTAQGQPGMASAIVGMTSAMNNLTSTIHQTSMQTDAAISNRTAQVINEAEYLTNNEKALLYLYFSNRPAEASPLPDMDGNFRKAVFQIALAKLQS